MKVDIIKSELVGKSHFGCSGFNVRPTVWKIDWCEELLFPADNISDKYYPATINDANRLILYVKVAERLFFSMYLLPMLYSSAWT